MSRQLNMRGSANEPFETGATQSYPLGTRMHVDGERIFRYTKNDATALSVARVVSAARPIFGLEDRAVSSGAVASGATGEGVNITVSVPLGTKIITNEYKEGLLFVNDGSGEGHVYVIASNPTTDLTLTTAAFTISAPPHLTISTTSRVTLLRNRYQKVVQYSPSQATQVLGITPVAVSASAYFWLQTGGPCAALQQDDLLENLPVAASDITNGAVAVATNVVPQYGFGTDSSSKDASGYAVVRAPGGNIVAGSRGGGNRERLAAVSGLAVVPNRSIGWCVNARQHGQHALVWLTLEG